MRALVKAAGHAPLFNTIPHNNPNVCQALTARKHMSAAALKGATAMREGLRPN